MVINNDVIPNSIDLILWRDFLNFNNKEKLAFIKSMIKHPVFTQCGFSSLENVSGFEKPLLNKAISKVITMFDINNEVQHIFPILGFDILTTRYSNWVFRLKFKFVCEESQMYESDCIMFSFEIQDLNSNMVYKNEHDYCYELSQNKNKYKSVIYTFQITMKFLIEKALKTLCENKDYEEVNEYLKDMNMVLNLKHSTLNITDYQSNNKLFAQDLNIMIRNVIGQSLYDYFSIVIQVKWKLFTKESTEEFVKIYKKHKDDDFLTRIIDYFNFILVGRIVFDDNEFLLKYYDGENLLFTQDLSVVILEKKVGKINNLFEVNQIKLQKAVDKYVYEFQQQLLSHEAEKISS